MYLNKLATKSGVFFAAVPVARVEKRCQMFVQRFKFPSRYQTTKKTYKRCACHRKQTAGLFDIPL